jgi:hypothetical protein
MFLAATLEKILKKFSKKSSTRQTEKNAPLVGAAFPTAF